MTKHFLLDWTYAVALKQLEGTSSNWLSGWQFRNIWRLG
ncbi:predicted protein [Histoplasma mississippiense (nom. inval.)]|nr:predicted protein [Histoplasma mississippiense (nom. inval.)]EDN04480.1 predicted protein [Histoplasma mississippiense (nom. inval.)]